MEWISVKDRLPDYEDCGVEFLCLIKTVLTIRDYEICEWFNPMTDITEEESNSYEKHERPEFLVRYSGSSREVTHWMPLPEPPKL